MRMKEGKRAGLRLNIKKTKILVSSPICPHSVTCSCWVFKIPRTAAHQASLTITNSWSFLKLITIESVMPSNHLVLCHPLLLLPSIIPTIRVFSKNWLSSLHQGAKDWSFSFSISPSDEYSGLISFRMDWLDLLAVQGTLKSILQHHSSKASILWHSAFFMIQLSHPYMTTGKMIALTRLTFVGKIIALLFKMLSRLLKLKLQYFSHLMQKANSFEKTLMLGKIEGRRRGWQRMRWLDALRTQWTWVWVDSGSWWWTGRPGMLQFMKSQSWTWLSDWTELN